MITMMKFVVRESENRALRFVAALPPADAVSTRPFDLHDHCVVVVTTEDATAVMRLAADHGAILLDTMKPMGAS